jgi:probable metal-binding protein
MSTSAPNQVHGHDVIDMMQADPRPYTRLTLTRAIVERFGEDTRFCTCSAEGMTAAELVDFLADRQKFMPAGDGFIVNPDRVCRH